MSVVNNSLLLTGDDGYQIERSVRLRSSASAYLNRTPGTAGNRKTWTWSGWVKRGQLGAVQGLFEATPGGFNLTSANIQSTGEFGFQLYADPTYNTVWTSSAVFRDPSAWYHIVFSFNTTEASLSNTVKLYVNGVSQTLSHINYNSAPPQNGDWFVNATTSSHRIGVYNSANFFDGYLTEVNFIDGQALTPSSFGETDVLTGVWKPKKYAGTYGTNGFYLNFSDNSAATAAAIGADSSGNGNNWTPNNISVTAGATYDSMIDVPTPYADGGNGRGNYAVLNPLARYNLPWTFSQANLRADLPGGSNGWTRLVNSIAVSSGKWYCEAAFQTDAGAGEWGYIGIKSSAGDTTLSSALGAPSDEWVFVDSGFRRNNNSTTAYGTAQGSSFTLRMALDLDNGSIWWGDASGWFASGNPETGANPAYTGLSGLFYVLMGLYRSTATVQILFANFGQRPFAYTPPAGFKALNTQNLPESTVVDGGEYFNTVLYTGNGTSQSITGVGFQPDFSWIKQRNADRSHGLYDAVRGATNVLLSNSTLAELTSSERLSAFNSDGFNVGSDALTNQSAGSYVAWNWKANGAGVSNTDGSITSTVSANTTAGFSVVTYTGTGANATVGHGLGVAPRMVIVKNRGGTSSWGVYHASIGAANAVYLNLTNASAITNNWNSTAPTSSVFSIGTAGEANPSGGNLVAYCFSEVAGYSKFGSYTGNGSADGPFVFCGFRPRFVMYKRTDSAGDNWNMLDTTRSDVNVADEYLFANSSSAEGFGATVMDILSNGFKLRFSGSGGNASGGTYIFAAFAEHPFQSTLAR